MTTFTPEQPRTKPRTLGQQCLSFADDLGYVLDPTSDYHNDTFGSLSQAEVIEVLWETDPMTGKLYFSVAGESQARQNGKGQIYEVVELFDAYVLGSNVLRNAHEVPTAKEALKRAYDRASTTDLSKKIFEHRTGNGELCLTFKAKGGGKGGGIYYRARTGSAGRGVTNISRITYDEAQEIKANQVQATSSTSLITPYGRQIAFLGSAGLKHSEYWYDLRIEGIRKTNPRMLWNEFTAERVTYNSDGEMEFLTPDVQDRALWYQANVALVWGRMDIADLETELTILTEQAFLEEHLNVWTPPPERFKAGAKKVKVADWKKLHDPSSTYKGKFVVGIAADHMGRSASVGIASWRSDGIAHLEMTEHLPGTSWVGPYLSNMLAKRKPSIVFLDTAGSSVELRLEIQRICKERAVKLVEVNKSKMAEACSNFARKVKDAEMIHLGEPLLMRAIETAQYVGYGPDELWRWRESDEFQTSSLVVMTMVGNGIDLVSKRKSAYAGRGKES